MTILISVFGSESSYISNSYKLFKLYINLISLLFTLAINICFLCSSVRYLNPSSIIPKSFLFSRVKYNIGFHVASLINFKIIFLFDLSTYKHLKTEFGEKITFCSLYKE